MNLSYRHRVITEREASFSAEWLQTDSIQIVWLPNKTDRERCYGVMDKKKWTLVVLGQYH